MAEKCPVLDCGANVDLLRGGVYGNLCRCPEAVACAAATVKITGEGLPLRGMVSLSDETRMQTTGPITATEVNERLAQAMSDPIENLGAALTAPVIDKTLEIMVEKGLVSALPDDNPKTAHGALKTPMHLIPFPALVEMAEVFKLGAAKYGAFNWRVDRVSASVYYSAAMRHMGAWFEGEDFDPESGRPHLAHAMDCFAIVVDAAHYGMLNDDRPPIPAREACKGKAGFDERGRPAPMELSNNAKPFYGPSFDVIGGP